MENKDEDALKKDAPEQEMRNKRKNPSRQEERRAEIPKDNSNSLPKEATAPVYGGQAVQDAPVKKSNKFAFAVLCIVLFIMFGGFIIGLIGTLIGICAIPIWAIASGITAIVYSARSLLNGFTAYGLYDLGASFMIIGAGVFLFPLCFKLVILLCKLFKTCFVKFKSQFYEGGNR